MENFKTLVALSLISHEEIWAFFFLFSGKDASPELNAAVTALQECDFFVVQELTLSERPLHNLNFREQMLRLSHWAEFFETNFAFWLIEGAKRPLFWGNSLLTLILDGLLPAGSPR